MGAALCTHATRSCLALTFRSNPSYCFWPSSSHGHSSYALLLASLFQGRMCECFIVSHRCVDEAGERAIQRTNRGTVRQAKRGGRYCVNVKQVAEPNGRRKTPKEVRTHSTLSSAGIRKYPPLLSSQTLRLGTENIIILCWSTGVNSGPTRPV